MSRRALLRALGPTTCALALGGCASLGATGTGPRADASSLALDPTLLVATTRKRVKGGKPWFGPERAAMTIARAKLVPPDDGRFTLAAAGLDDWRLDTVEPMAGEIGDLLA